MSNRTISTTHSSVEAWSFGQAIKVILSLCLIMNGPLTFANGIYGNGIGADAMSMGGAEVAWAADPLSAMTANPAGLGFLTQPQAELGLEGASLQGTFKKTGSGGTLDSSFNALPEGSLDYPLENLPITLGLSVAPQSALLANWHYNDPPGGLGGATSYGNQQNESEILLLRSALGAAWQINPRLSIGLSVGLLYNENKLIAPYLFQDAQPAGLNGAKTLLNLQTSGFGGDASAGILFRATTNLQFGAFYQSESLIDSSGNASGDAYQQFGLAPGAMAFHYDAVVQTKFPQSASLGVSWRCLPRLRFSAQIDWIDWAHTFDTLHILLSNGSGPGVANGLPSALKDNSPLNWSSEFVYRIGWEYTVTDNLALRLGYCYGNSPVPSATLTPLTAAITEQTLTAGAGYHWGRYHVDLAYQYYLPTTQNVGQSGLLTGEYSNSSNHISAQVLALLTGFTF
jgi:long-chain fatty acid transport protein